jgi:hypothetical protein
MPFQPHHIFVCTSAGAPEAQALLDAGLLEGSGNTHPGQGTANRRFFFESGYLELLWVHDELEARSDLTAPTKLWDRWAGRGTAANPFGLCFSSARETEAAPAFPTRQYRPGYLPQGRCFYIADQMPLAEPEVFLLGWPQDQAPLAAEPKQHPLGLCRMRTVSIGLAEPDSISGTLRAISNAGLARIHRSTRPELIIEFTATQAVRQYLPGLGITLVGNPA